MAAVTLTMTRHSLRAVVRRAVDSGSPLRLDHVRAVAVSGSSPLLPAERLLSVLDSIKHREARLAYDGFGTLTVSDGDGNQATTMAVSP